MHICKRTPPRVAVAVGIHQVRQCCQPLLLCAHISMLSPRRITSTIKMQVGHKVKIPTPQLLAASSCSRSSQRAKGGGNELTLTGSIIG